MSNLTRNAIMLTAAYLVFAGAIGGYLFLSGKIVKRTDANKPELVAQGKALYETHCAACHGMNLKGEPDWERQRADGTFPAPPQDASGHTWQHSDRQLFDYITLGGANFAPRGVNSNMPGFETVLDNAQVWSVIAYVKSRWPPDTRQKQIQTNFIGSLHRH